MCTDITDAALYSVATSASLPPLIKVVPAPPTEYGPPSAIASFTRLWNGIPNNVVSAPPTAPGAGVDTSETNDAEDLAGMVIPDRCVNCRENDGVGESDRCMIWREKDGVGEPDCVRLGSMNSTGVGLSAFLTGDSPWRCTEESRRLIESGRGESWRESDSLLGSPGES